MCYFFECTISSPWRQLHKFVHDLFFLFVPESWSANDDKQTPPTEVNVNTEKAGISEVQVAQRKRVLRSTSPKGWFGM